MRTNKQLLQLILDEARKIKTGESFPAGGLCNIARRLYRNNQMTSDECGKVKRYILYHMPQSYRVPGYPMGVYGWPPRELEPRIEFLEKHIKLQSKKS